jgi:hypothetical protein
MTTAAIGKEQEEQSDFFAAWLARSGATDPLAEFGALNLDALDEDLRIRYAVSRTWTPGADEIRIPSRFFGLLYPHEAPAQMQRVGAVAFRFPEDLRQDVRVTPPEGYGVASYPADLSLTSSFLVFDRTHEEIAGNVHLSSSLRIQESSVDSGQFGALVKFLDEIRKAGDEEFVFRKTPLLGKAGE